MYGLSARFATRPSQPLRQASAKNASPSRLRCVENRSARSSKRSASRSRRLRGAQGERPDVVAVEPDDVEDVKEDRDVSLAPPGELGKARLRPGECHDLAVHGEALLRLGLERGGDLGIASVQGQVVARQQRDVVAVANATQRTPSSLRSKIQPSSLKRSFVSTAFIAFAWVGAGLA